MADRKNTDGVGYGKPPKQTRFAKGQSGNPSDRPKGAKNLSTILQKVGRGLVRVNSNGRSRQMTKLEASMHQLANKAASGDLKAIRELLYWSRLFAESGQEPGADSGLDENDKSALVSILRRLQQVSNPEEKLDSAADDDPAQPEEEP